LKGIVFNLLEEVVTRDYSADTWDDLLEAASVDGSYTSLGSYPDEDLSKLVTAASSALQQSPEDVIRWFGRRAVPLLADKYPRLFQPHTSTRSFILTLNEIIHPEVRKIYPGADVPEFDFEVADNALLLGYSSKRRLCSFAQGLIEGTADHYEEQVELQHLKCMVRGDDKCLIKVDFNTNGAHVH
jgi:predicted hydrocarbon binding protein